MGGRIEDGSSLSGVVEIDQGPPTTTTITHIAESLVNGRDHVPSIPLSIEIANLKRIDDAGGDLKEYILELEEKSRSETHEHGRISKAIERIRDLAQHNTQVIIDGHQVGGRTTAIVSAAGTLAVGAGIFLRLRHGALRPAALRKKSDPKSKLLKSNNNN